MRLTQEQSERVTENHNLIYYMIHKFHLDIEEYYDILAIGLCKACLSWDISKGKLSTYACTIMYNEIRQYLRTVHNSKNKCLHYALSLDAKLSDFGNDPEFEDLNYLGSMSNGHSDLLDELVLFDFSKLSEREKQIVKYRYMGYNQDKIGKLLGVSQSYVARVSKAIQNKLERSVAC